MNRPAPSAPEFSRLVDVESLRARGERRAVTAEPAELAAIAARFDLIALRSLRADVEISPWRGDGWRLNARVRADADQRCGVTLGPAPIRVDETVKRGFLPARRIATPKAEAEMWFDSEIDDTPELLEETIDLGEILTEALGLALDPYPRAPEETPLEIEAAPPGAAPLSHETQKPFAGLAALKAKLEGEG